MITGASRGIGLATARRFLRRGAAVVNLSRTPCPEPGVVSVTADLCRLDHLGAVADELAERVPQTSRITLVHAAARLGKDDAVTLDPAELEAILRLNVVAVHALDRLLVPRMGPGSAVVYVGSTLGEKAVAGAFSYVVSKHAMVGMMRALCQDLAGRQIHTACVCPGFTDTEMLRAHVGHDEGILASIAAASTFGRLIEPDEIASVIEFAADHPVVNGAVLHANLGQVES